MTQMGYFCSHLCNVACKIRECESGDVTFSHIVQCTLPIEHNRLVLLSRREEPKKPAVPHALCYIIIIGITKTRHNQKFVLLT